MNSNKLKVIELILVLSVAFLPSIVLSFIYLYTGQYVARLGSTGTTPAYIYSIIASFLPIAVLFYVLFRNGKTYKDIGIDLEVKFKDISSSIILLLVCYALLYSASLALSFIFTTPAENAATNKYLETITNASLGLMVVYAIIVPVLEELIVRGFAMTEIIQLTESKTHAVIISTFIQFSYHLYQGPQLALASLPIFLLFSIYFARTRKLNHVIFAHILYDLLWVFSQTHNR